MASRERQRLRQFRSVQKKTAAKSAQPQTNLSSAESSEPLLISFGVPTLDVFSTEFSRLSTKDNNALPLERRLPVELWLKIFRLAIGSDEDEFSLDISTYNAKLCDKGEASAVHSLSQEAQILKHRTSIVRVCKYWYSIGTQALWSHLRLVIPRTGSKESTISLLKSLREAPQIASYVFRLTIIVIPRKEPIWLPTNVAAIIEQLPNLEILDFPLFLGASSIPLKQSINILRLYGPQLLQLPREDRLSQNIRIMVLRLNDVVSLEIQKIELPRLESLDIKAMGGDRDLARAIPRLWTLPSLRILSITSTTTVEWVRCLNEWGGRLEKLQLRVERSVWDHGEQEVQLPLLKIFYFSADCPTSIERNIKAPKLKRLGIFDIGNRTLSCSERITSALDNYSTISELCLVATGVHCVTCCVTNPELEEWRGRGIQVEMRKAPIPSCMCGRRPL